MQYARLLVLKLIEFLLFLLDFQQEGHGEGLVAVSI
jgi:hypothetical protein